MRSVKKTREDTLFESVIERAAQSALPSITSDNVVEFKPLTPQQITPSTNFMQHKQNTINREAEPAQETQE